MRWWPSTALPNAAFHDLQAMGSQPLTVAQLPDRQHACDVVWADSWESAETLHLPANSVHDRAAHAAVYASLQQNQPIDTKTAAPPVHPAPLAFGRQT